MTADELAAFYPEGRTFYFEGGDLSAFLKATGKTMDEVTVTAHVPAEALGDFYAESDNPNRRFLYGT